MLNHRGPDGQRHWVAPHRRVGLGHTRLSIIDLVTGDQPIANENEQLHIIVNGEFYGYEAIRQELQQCGHQLRTQSDSEIAPPFVRRSRRQSACTACAANSRLSFGTKRTNCSWRRAIDLASNRSTTPRWAIPSFWRPRPRPCSRRVSRRVGITNRSFRSRTSISTRIAACSRECIRFPPAVICWPPRDRCRLSATGISTIPAPTSLPSHWPTRNMSTHARCA